MGARKLIKKWQPLDIKVYKTQNHSTAYTDTHKQPRIHQSYMPMYHRKLFCYLCFHYHVSPPLKETRSSCLCSRFNAWKCRLLYSLFISTALFFFSSYCCWLSLFFQSIVYVKTLFSLTRPEVGNNID